MEKYKTGYRVVLPSEGVLLRIINLFGEPENHLEMTVATELMPPNDFPAIKHFKRCLYRLADSSSRAARLQNAGTGAKDSLGEDPLTEVLNELFIQCCLPNLLNAGLWGRDGKGDVDNVVADVMSCQIVR